MLLLRGTSTGWRDGQQESCEVQQRESPSPACWEGQPQAPAQAGSNWLESISVEKHLRVLVDTRWDKSQQCTLVTKEAESILAVLRSSPSGQGVCLLV